MISPIAGILSDNFKPYSIRLIGLLLIASGCLAISTFNSDLTVYGYILRIAPYGLRTEMFISSNIWFYLKRTSLHKVLAAAPTLRWHHTVSAGVNHILTPTFLEHNIILTSSAGVNAVAVAEFVLTFMLYHTKQIAALQTLRGVMRKAPVFQAGDISGWLNLFNR